MRSIAPSYDIAGRLQSEDDQRKFIISFRLVAQTLSTLKTFSKFDWKDLADILDEDEYLGYKSWYLYYYDLAKKARDKDVKTVLVDIDFNIELIRTDKINVVYILNLLKDAIKKDENEKKRSIDLILRDIERSDNERLRAKQDMLKRFVTEKFFDLSPDEDIVKAYEEFELQQQRMDIEIFAEESGLDVDTVNYFMSEYQFKQVKPFEFNDISEAKIVANITKAQFADKYLIEWLRLNKRISNEEYHSLISDTVKPIASPKLLEKRLECIMSGDSIIIENAQTAYNEILNKLNDNNVFLVACFSKATPIDDDMMWGYYGDSHKGYCIEISLDKMRYYLNTQNCYCVNKDEINTCNEFLSNLYFVKYTNKLVCANISKYIRRYIKNKTKLFESLDFIQERKKLQFRALKQKKKCWSNENEIRLIVDPSNTNFDLSDANISIPQSCITYVFAGNRSTDDAVKDIENQFKQRSLQEKIENICGQRTKLYADDDLPF